MSNTSAVFDKISHKSTPSEVDLIPASPSSSRSIKPKVNRSDSEEESPSNPTPTLPRYEGRGKLSDPLTTKTPRYGSSYTSAYSQSALLNSGFAPVKGASAKHWAEGDAPHHQPEPCHNCCRIVELLEAMKHENKSLRHEIKSLAISITEMRNELHCLKESTSRFPTTSASSKVVKVTKGPKYDDGNI